MIQSQDSSIQILKNHDEENQFYEDNQNQQKLNTQQDLSQIQAQKIEQEMKDANLQNFIHRNQLRNFETSSNNKRNRKIIKTQKQIAKKNQMEEELVDLQETKERFQKFMNRSSVDNQRNNFLKGNHFMNKQSYESTKIGIDNNLVYFDDQLNQLKQIRKRRDNFERLQNSFYKFANSDIQKDQSQSSLQNKYYEFMQLQKKKTKLLHENSNQTEEQTPSNKLDNFNLERNHTNSFSEITQNIKQRPSEQIKKFETEYLSNQSKQNDRCVKPNNMFFNRQMSTPRILFKKLEQSSISRPKNVLNPSKSTKKVEINVSNWNSEEDQLKLQAAKKIASECQDKKYQNLDFEQINNKIKVKKRNMRPMTSNFEFYYLKQKLNSKNINSVTKLNEFNQQLNIARTYNYQPSQRQIINQTQNELINSLKYRSRGNRNKVQNFNRSYKDNLKNYSQQLMNQDDSNFQKQNILKESILKRTQKSLQKQDNENKEIFESFEEINSQNKIKIPDLRAQINQRQPTLKNINYQVEYADNPEQYNKKFKSKSAVRSPSNSKDKALSNSLNKFLSQRQPASNTIQRQNHYLKNSNAQFTDNSMNLQSEKKEYYDNIASLQKSFSFNSENKFKYFENYKNIYEQMHSKDLNNLHLQINELKNKVNLLEKNLQIQNYSSSPSTKLQSTSNINQQQNDLSESDLIQNDNKLSQLSNKVIILDQLQKQKVAEENKIKMKQIKQSSPQKLAQNNEIKNQVKNRQAIYQQLLQLTEKMNQISEQNIKMRKKLRSKTQQTKAKNKLIIELLKSTYVMTQALLYKENQKRCSSDKKGKQKKESRPQLAEKLKQKITDLNEQIKQKTIQYQDMFTQAYNQQSIEKTITNIQINQNELVNSVDFQNDQNIAQLSYDDNQYDQISLLNSIVQKQLEDQLNNQFDQSIQQLSQIDQKHQLNSLNETQDQKPSDKFSNLQSNQQIQKSNYLQGDLNKQEISNKTQKQNIQTFQDESNKNNQNDQSPKKKEMQEKNKAEEFKNSVKEIKQQKPSDMIQKTDELKPSVKEIKQQTPSTIPQKATDLQDPVKETKQQKHSGMHQKNDQIKDSVKEIKKCTPSDVIQKTDELKPSIKEIKQQTLSTIPLKVNDLQDSVKEITQKASSVFNQQTVESLRPIQQIKQETLHDKIDKQNSKVITQKQPQIQESQNISKLGNLIKENKVKIVSNQSDRLNLKNEISDQNNYSQTKKTEDQQNFVKEIEEESLYDESDQPNQQNYININLSSQNNSQGINNFGNFVTKRSSTLQISSQNIIKENLQLTKMISFQKTTNFQIDIEDQNEDSYSEDTLLTIQIDFLKQIQEKISMLFNDSFEKQASQRTSPIKKSERNYEPKMNKLQDTIQQNDENCLIQESNRSEISMKDSIKINQHGIINLDQVSESQGRQTERITERMILSQKQTKFTSLETIKIRNNEQINKETSSFYASYPIDKELIKMFGEEKTSLLNREINNILKLNNYKNTDDLASMVKLSLMRIAVKMLGFKLLDSQAPSQLTLKDLFQQSDFKILFVKQINSFQDQNQEILIIKPNDFIKRINQLLSSQNYKIEQLPKFSQQILFDNNKLDDEYEESLLALFQSKLYSNQIIFSQVEQILGIFGVSSSNLEDSELSSEQKLHDIDSIRLKNRVNQPIDSTDSDYN